ncbi:MAG: FKBP-type peptidyl-prolyl cis-trans isomerase [Gammaproteobacteria bacterium]|nr:FKBP-type peptidyl-prolyl cis-trans isomerase [Gammaproteobacteria bacterium]
MGRFLLVVTTIALSATVCAKTPETEDDKTFYALGLAIAESLGQYDLTKDELEMLQSGLTAGVTGGPAAVDLKEYRPKLAELGRSRTEAAAGKEKQASAKFVENTAAEAGAQKFDSGLIMFELVAGDGPNPTASDTVTVHYHGTLRDGTVFDSSVDRGTPATFPLTRVISCWTEGVQKIKVGGKARLVCPSDIAYGDRGSPPRIQPGAALIFEVELLEIK